MPRMAQAGSTDEIESTDDHLSTTKMDDGTRLTQGVPSGDHSSVTPQSSQHSVTDELNASKNENVKKSLDLQSTDVPETQENVSSHMIQGVQPSEGAQNNLTLCVEELGDMLSDEDEALSDDASGEESDIEDNDEITFPIRRRDSNPVLPETVTSLETPEGSKVYVVGTAHFSLESQEDVAQVIRATQPDFVMIELCKSRINILELDEATLLEEAKNINMEKIRTAIKQSGMVQGVMHLLLLSMSAHLTKELGMAPGGEFRRAFQEARRVPGCRLQLGDRPIQITLKRALAALSLWQKIRLAWYLITSKDPISKEDVEKCKQRDLLEQMLREMTGEFPALSRVFVDERDLFLAHSLKVAARPIQCSEVPEGYIPSVVVGVVGIGHVPGIVSNWNKEQNIQEILIVPEASLIGKLLRWSFRASVLGLVTYGCYRIFRLASHMF